ncbi:hypothetical protein GW17_00060569 [Ensete ventricosum]|nr:hypothetical protein GW17_00060569 [Ensete ventricosum]RZS12883.1 hypothetical protein BHM03_00044391 [Ensete ventricosum]
MLNLLHTSASYDCILLTMLHGVEFRSPWDDHEHSIAFSSKEDEDLDGEQPPAFLLLLEDKGDITRESKQGEAKEARKHKDSTAKDSKTTEDKGGRHRRDLKMIETLA